MKSRRRSRELALQALYSMEIAHEALDKILADIRLENEAECGPEVIEYAERLARETIKRLGAVDAVIKKQCVNWEIDRVAVLDKNILRLAITEILNFEDIPPKVSIDEAIELAKKFSTEKSGIFINGILDPIAFKKGTP